MNSQLDYPVAPTRVGCIARAVSKTRFGRLVKCSGNVRIDIFLSPDSIQTLEFTWPSNVLCAASCKRRLLPSRVGGGWNEQARQAETGHVKAAEIEAPSSGSGSQQNGRTAYVQWSPNADTDMPSMNSSSGIAPSHDSRSTKLSSRAIGFPSRTADSQRAQSMGDLPRSAG